MQSGMANGWDGNSFAWLGVLSGKSPCANIILPHVVVKFFFYRSNMASLNAGYGKHQHLCDRAVCNRQGTGHAARAWHIAEGACGHGGHLPWVHRQGGEYEQESQIQLQPHQCVCEGVQMLLEGFFEG